MCTAAAFLEQKFAYLTPLSSYLDFVLSYLSSSPSYTHPNFASLDLFENWMLNRVYIRKNTCYGLITVTFYGHILRFSYGHILRLGTVTFYGGFSYGHFLRSHSTVQLQSLSNERACSFASYTHQIMLI